MFKDKRMAFRLKNTFLSFLFTFLLLLLLTPAGFAQEKISPSENDTQAQQISIEQRIAELETKLQSIKEQIDKAKQPEAASVWLQYGMSTEELQKHSMLLEETTAVIQQQITALRRHASFQQLQKRRKNILASIEDLAIPLLPPYSLSTGDAR